MLVIPFVRYVVILELPQQVLNVSLAQAFRATLYFVFIGDAILPGHCAADALVLFRVDVIEHGLFSGHFQAHSNIALRCAISAAAFGMTLVLKGAVTKCFPFFVS